jgi:hypothetical protein
MPLYQRAIVDDEETIENFEEEVTTTEELTPEEATYKKRYGDLRRFQQSEAAKFRKELDALKQQLASTTKQNLNLPNSTNEADIDQWMAEYPQVAAIVAGIASRQANAATDEVKSRVAELDSRRQQMDEEYAQRKIDEIHPDFFNEIRVDEKFHQWLAEQSQFIQDAMYVNSTDWKMASNVIDMYKAQNGIVTKNNTTPKADTRKEAAKDVNARGGRTPPSVGGEVLFRESQIAKMTGEEYERNEEAIAKAWAEGKVLRDMTAGAR